MRLKKSTKLEQALHHCRTLFAIATACPAGPLLAGHDLVIYGGTPAAITAALEARDLGRSVVIVSPDKRLGGMTTHGLGWTDAGNTRAVGGMARDFYREIWKHYRAESAWKWQQREDYHKLSPKNPFINDTEQVMWNFEPHVAEEVIGRWISLAGVEVVQDEWLDRADGVEMKDGRIHSIQMLSGRRFAGKMFLDTTYEGDLMAAAKVSFTVGREANATYGETCNGVQTARATSHQITLPIDAHVIPGDPSSGLLPRVSAARPGPDGSADSLVQAYCFRVCMTDEPKNRVPFPKPNGYDANQYELCLRYLLAGQHNMTGKFDPIPNRKTDTNNHGGFSFDNIGMSHDYPLADYGRRHEIVREHRVYQQGLLWFLANDPRVPAPVRDEVSRWGLAADEFVETGHWPPQLYIREARRMVSDFVMSEGHATRRLASPRPIGMGSYAMDSHNVQRYADANGHARNEGDVQVSPGGAYPIDYGAIVPKRGECRNLLVPVCLSASHIAYGSIRMEPVFMILGQSAAAAADLAISRELAVQDVPYDALRTRLLARGQRLETPSK